MPIGDKPILEIIIGQLAAQGIEHITLAVSHQAEILQAYFSDGSKWKELHDRIEAARTLVAVQHEAAS